VPAAAPATSGLKVNDMVQVPAGGWPVQLLPLRANGPVMAGPSMLMTAVPMLVMQCLRALVVPIACEPKVKLSAGTEDRRRCGADGDRHHREPVPLALVVLTVTGKMPLAKGVPDITPVAYWTVTPAASRWRCSSPDCWWRRWCR